MRTPMAPAFCAFLTLTIKPHVPRSISAILPATAEALVMGEQPSVVEGPAPSPGSSASTTSPVTPVSVSGGPKAAAPKGYGPIAGNTTLTWMPLPATAGHDHGHRASRELTDEPAARNLPHFATRYY